MLATATSTTTPTTAESPTGREASEDVDQGEAVVPAHHVAHDRIWPLAPARVGAQHGGTAAPWDSTSWRPAQSSAQPLQPKVTHSTRRGSKRPGRQGRRCLHWKMNSQNCCLAEGETTGRRWTRCAAASNLEHAQDLVKGGHGSAAQAFRRGPTGGDWTGTTPSQHASAKLPTYNPRKRRVSPELLQESESLSLYRAHTDQRLRRSLSKGSRTEGGARPA